MAEAESRSITRRAMVAGSSVFSAAAVARVLPEARAAAAQLEKHENRVPEAKAAPDFAGAPSGLQPAADPIHAAIVAHAGAYAAYVAQLNADEADDVIMEALCKTERETADAFAATVPATLQGAAAALGYVRMLHERDRCSTIIGATCSSPRRRGRCGGRSIPPRKGRVAERSEAGWRQRVRNPTRLALKARARHPPRYAGRDKAMEFASLNRFVG
jgi:hypothetical protein